MVATRAALALEEPLAVQEATVNKPVVNILLQVPMEQGGDFSWWCSETERERYPLMELGGALGLAGSYGAGGGFAWWLVVGLTWTTLNERALGLKPALWKA